ncbi:MAG: N-methylhydantoinase B [Gammaproteobacteria bacterium]|jgi:N-methylhydantoinase B
MSTSVKPGYVDATSTRDESIAWDGRVHSYRPSAVWKSRISDRLAFHVETDPDLDPVTYEVIRHRLWTTNMAHGETITRISGSPVFASLDFNMCILTEDAEVVMNAPFVQYLDAGAPLAMRFIMEKFSDNPGIEEGDVYLSNDPWIGASHQMDVLIATPVFVDGKLFAWVSSAGHQYDLGGTVPGGWPQNAVDVYSDPTVFMPFKLVEKGVLRPDLEMMYRRQSRMPDLVALDLRAQIAGSVFARDQIVELCAKFGAATVKAAMRRVLDDSQKGLQEKLLKIPDGTWSVVQYFDEKLPGDRTTHRVQINMTKKGDRLIVDNQGTDAQDEGPNGFTYVSFSGAVIGSMSVTMLFEQLFAIGGADRQIDYQPTPGLLTCVDYPAAVSGGVLNVVVYMNAIQTCIGRMLSTDPGLKMDLLAASGSVPLALITGKDDRGQFFGSAFLEILGTGSGARATRDGVDTGGPALSPLSAMLNVEGLEQWYPIVYLYRREGTDTGGCGKWRGGVGIDFAITPYRAESISLVTNTGGSACSTHGGEGLMGGYPSPTSHYIVGKDTNLGEVFQNKSVPSDIRDLDAKETIQLRAKSNGTPLGVGDVMEVRVVGGGGYGDPLERDPERVVVDINSGYVSVEAARAAHGVVLGENKDLDRSATDNCRSAMLEARGRWQAGPAVTLSEDVMPATGEAERLVHETVIARDKKGARELACARCGHTLGGYRSNFKKGLLMDESPITVLPATADPSYYLDDEMRLRRYCCPGCKVLMATDVVRIDEPTLEDMRLV